MRHGCCPKEKRKQIMMFEKEALTVIFVREKLQKALDLGEGSALPFGLLTLQKKHRYPDRSLCGSQKLR
jgi:hypothetical protein